MRVLRAHYNPPANGAPQVRTLSPAEVHVLWARMRRWETDEERAAVEADIKDALALDPNTGVYRRRVSESAEPANATTTKPAR